MRILFLALLGVVMSWTSVVQAQNTFMITSVLPYRIICEKQSDGKELIKVQLCVRKEPAVLDAIKKNLKKSGDFQGKSVVLQPKSIDDFATLAAEFAATGTVYGIKAQMIFDNRSNNELTSYLIKSPETCCGGGCQEFAKKFLNLEDDEELVWKDLDHESGDLKFCPNPNEYILCANAHSGFLAQFAAFNLHRQACCCPDFGLKDEFRTEIVYTILKKLMNPGCGDFTATGTFGSCGDTGSVSVTGVRKVEHRVDICGDCFRLVDLNGDAAQKVIKMIFDKINNYYFFMKRDPILPCGLDCF